MKKSKKIFVLLHIVGNQHEMIVKIFDNETDAINEKNYMLEKYPNAHYVVKSKTMSC